MKDKFNIALINILNSVVKLMLYKEINQEVMVSLISDGK